MTGLFIPPWYKPVVPTLEEFAAACVVWGFSLGLSAFAGIRASMQTAKQWRRMHKVTLYVVLIWLELLSSTAIGGITYGYLRGTIAPSFWLFGGIIFLWIFQVHCTLQIIINRIALLALSKSLVRRLKWGVFIFVLLINIAVACIWIPAQLQISQRYIHINDYWDHTEKILLAIIDVSLNLYFIYLVRSSLIAYGLVKYVRLYRFNVAMILLSMTMDVLIIAMMSLKNSFFYVFFHPLAYLVKLHIELSMADLIVKIVKASTQSHYCVCGVHGNEKLVYDNGLPVDSLPSHMAPTTRRFNRLGDWRQFRAKHKSLSGAGVPVPPAPPPTLWAREYRPQPRTDALEITPSMDISTWSNHSEALMRQRTRTIRSDGPRRDVQRTLGMTSMTFGQASRQDTKHAD